MRLSGDGLDLKRGQHRAKQSGIGKLSEGLAGHVLARFQVCSTGSLLMYSASAAPRNESDTGFAIVPRREVKICCRKTPSEPRRPAAAGTKMLSKDAMVFMGIEFWIGRMASSSCG